MKVRGIAMYLKPVCFPLFAVLLYSCGGSDEAGVAGQVEARTIAVTVVEADFREVRDELHSVGRVISRNTPTLAAEVSARVTDVRVDEGQSVQQGQVLLTLDRTTFELAEQEALANIQRLNANIGNEQRRVERYRGLKDKDMMPQERLDDAEANLAVYRASLAAAEAQLAIVRDRLTKTELVSPVTGRVEKRHVSVGDFVKDGGALFTLTDTIHLRVELPFPETVGGLLQTGQVLLLESPVAPGLEVEAVVDEIRPEVSALSHSLVVTSNITNPGPWRPQATVEGVLVVEIRSDAVVVPSVSVVKRPAGDVVYRLDTPQAGEVRQVVISAGVRENGWTEILDGLRRGDTVVVEGAPYLTDGARVTVLEDPQ
jgi:membrane fusion protein (multidrug efflux system)